MATKTTVTLARSLKEQHAQRVPEYLRTSFHRVADGYLSAVDAATTEFFGKVKTGLYAQPDARAYLRAEVRNMARSFADNVVDAGHLIGTHEQLKKLREKATDIPRVDPEVAREIRAVLRTLPKDQREHAVRSSRNFELASAVLNAPGEGLGLDISGEGQEMLRRAFNETHRADLMRQIADDEALLAAAEEFKRTVLTELDEVLR
jgi:hypothetical protein